MHAHTPLTPSSFGLGLRVAHLPYIFEHQPAVDWFEIISENYMDTGGKPRRNIARIKERYPVVMHGVSLSIGTTDPLRSDYLYQLKQLIKEIKPLWVSDHLCWTGVAHKNTHDLLPVPYTEEALRHIVQRIREIQDFLEQPIALENPSTYLEFKTSAMPEAEFIARMVEASGCNLLLDINNVYVTCFNHCLDAKSYLDTLPMDRVIQVHLAGHSHKGTHIIDTHDHPVCDDVWELYKYLVYKAGYIPPTMIEWDDRIPEFPVLFDELKKARAYAANAHEFNLPAFPHLDALPRAMNDDTSLLSQQITLQNAIMQREAPHQPDEWIRAKEHFPAEKQLDVYSYAYRWRLFDVVAEDYPVLSTYLGEENFTQLIHDFISSTVPQHYNIARYAAALPAYQKTHPTSDMFSTELCMLETAIAQLADETETSLLTPEHLAGMTSEQLMNSHLAPRKALALYAFTHDVNGYYSAAKEDKSLKAPLQDPSWLAVFRHDDVMWRMELAEQEYHLLKQLFAGSTVGQALTLCKMVTPEHISEWFSRWRRNGLLAAPEYHTNIPKEERYVPA